MNRRICTARDCSPCGLVSDDRRRRRGRASARRGFARRPPLRAKNRCPAGTPRGFFGWRGTRRVEPPTTTRTDGTRGSSTAARSGYYWTTNLKLEVDVSGTSPSRYDTYEPHTVPGASYPFFIRTDHRVVTASLGGSVIYQFFENASFHPFVGAGAGVSRDTRTDHDAAADAGRAAAGRTVRTKSS